jgi:FdhD protein
MNGVARTRAHRIAPDATAAQQEQVAVEEPLEIRVDGETLAITMRTPGHDHELVAGFLLAEGIIDSHADLGSIAHCGRPGDEGYGNTIDARAAAGAPFDIERASAARRGTLVTAACGVCGRTSIEDLLQRRAPLDDTMTVPRDVIAALPERMRAKQAAFALTGGLHAAAIANGHGELACTREDIGRHNAVDKAIGRMLLDDALPGRGRVLVVSGRISFEIVQKAAVAGIAVLVGVSAPTSLAVKTAEAAGVTLVAFARGAAFNVYTHRARIT